MKTVFIATLIFCFGSTYANTSSKENLGTSSPLEAFATIKIESYDTASKSFKVLAVRHPGEGFSFVSPQALSVSIPELREELLIKKPQAYVGKKFVLSKKLANFTPEELERRKKSGSP